jgi:hypothetical protein
MDTNILKLYIKELVSINSNTDTEKYNKRKDDINEEFNPSLFIDDDSKIEEITGFKYNDYIENKMCDSVSESLDDDHKYKNLKYADLDNSFLKIFDRLVSNDINILLRKKKIKNLTGINFKNKDQLDLDIKLIIDEIFKNIINYKDFNPKDEYQLLSENIYNFFDNQIDKSLPAKYNNIKTDSNEIYHVTYDKYNSAKINNILLKIIIESKITNDQAWNDLNKDTIDFSVFDILMNEIISDFPFIDEIQLKDKPIDTALQQVIIYKLNGTEYVGFVNRIEDNQLIIWHVDGEYLFQPNLDKSKLIPLNNIKIIKGQSGENLLQSIDRSNFNSGDIVEINIPSDIIYFDHKYLTGQYKIYIHNYDSINLSYNTYVELNSFTFYYFIPTYIINMCNPKLITTITNMPTEIHPSGLGKKYEPPPPVPLPPPPPAPLPPPPPAPLPAPPLAPLPAPLPLGLNLNDDVVGIHFNGGKPIPGKPGEYFNVLVHGN